MGLFNFTPESFIKDTLSSFFGNPSQAWDRFKNGLANEYNYEVAQDNLEYQRERNKIEDARYDEETTYNRAFEENERDYQRAFAEEQRDYERALQQQIFEREDTAVERQASSLSNLGINPLSQNMSGLGSGQVIQSSAPVGATAPGFSARGGSPLNNQFQMQDSGMLPILSSMLSLADTVNGIESGKYQRDALALQNDKQFLDNLKIANGLGIDYHGYFNVGRKHYSERDDINFVGPDENGNPEYLTESKPYKSASYSEWRKMRKDSMPSWQYTLDSFGNDDVYHQAENALTKMSSLFDKASENIFKKDNYSVNPFKTLLNIFGLNF